MDRPAPLKITDPLEHKIQTEICSMLVLKGWFAKETHGSAFQQGFPDVYATHARFGPRWIEVKRPVGWKFTPAQLEDFPKLSANGTQIWILNAATEDQYRLLFRPANFYHYYLKSMGMIP
jgi:hypothetical protein